MSFSKTSIFCLILLMAFIAAPVVLAHDASQIANMRQHSHPTVALTGIDGPDDGTSVGDSPNEDEVPAHNAHPKVKSITPKRSTTAELAQTTPVTRSIGQNVILLADADADTIAPLTLDGNAAGQFTVVVEYDSVLATGSQIANSEYTVRAFRGTADVSSDITKTASSTTTAGGKSVEIILAVGTNTYYNTGTSEVTLPVHVWIDINADAVGGLAKFDADKGVTYAASDSNAFTSVGKSRITVVETFDETKPKLLITRITADNIMGNKATFKLSFNEKLSGVSGDALDAADITFAKGNGTVSKLSDAVYTPYKAADATAGTPEVLESTVYTLEVTLKDKTKPVTIGVKADSVKDAAGNSFEMAATGNTPTWTPDNTAPTLKITHSPADGKLPAGTNRNEVTFTFTFDDVIPGTGDAALQDADITLGGNGTKGTLSARDITTTVGSTIYTLTVTIIDTYKPVTVTVKAKSVKDDAGNEFTGGGSATFTPGSILVLPKNSYTIVVRKKVAHGSLNFSETNPTVFEWAAMPDLSMLSSRYISVQPVAVFGSAAPADGTVGISEIMWAIDEGYKINPSLDKITSQWIELHNLNDRDVRVLLTDTATAVDTAIDDVTTKDWTSVPGQNGDSVITSGKYFISMYRVPPTGQAGYNYKTDQYKNSDGTKAASWTTSNVTDSKGNLVSPHYRYAAGYTGTPGKINTHHTAAGRTKPSGAGFVINEVGNMSNDKYDWIELRNNTSGNVNVRNYMISIITSNSSDKPLIQFDANDNFEIPKNGVFLIVATDPAQASDPNHPIAPGYNIDKSDDEQEPGITKDSTTVRFKVQSFSLPNDGNFVLMVRRPDNHEGQRSGGHNDKGVAETGNADLDKVIDIAGWDNDLSKSAYPNPASSTSLWPLHNFAGADSKNKLAAGKVYKRNRVTTSQDRWGVGNEKDNNTGGSAFGAVGYQAGIGYRRAAAAINAHGGTPGYDNGTYKTRGTEAANPVFISEIMYAHTGATNSPPQWIELYNYDKAVGINLADFRLTLTNHADTMDKGAVVKNGWKGKDTASTTLGGVVLQPNSTVLITSTNAIRKNVFIPESRIFKISPRHSSAFGLTNRRDPMINAYGFEIVLEVKTPDGKGWVLVDKIGNLADRRTADQLDRGQDATKLRRFDDPRWMWPSGFDTEDPAVPMSLRARISQARLRDYQDGKLMGRSADGTKLTGWISSEDDSRTFRIEPVYYGHSSDISTPGQTVGQPLPVELSSFRPTLEDGKVTIRWTTESELDNAGFNIYRSETRDGEFKQVNAQLVEGAGTTGERNTYKWVDTTAKPDVVYYYQIEDVSFSGERQTLAQSRLKGYVSATNKLTTRWGELKKTLQ